MLPNYKTVRSMTHGQRERGSCVVVVDADSVPPRFCDRPWVGGVSTQHQLCYGHLHAPVIFKEDPQNQGSGILYRYCQKMGCQKLLPLDRFRGFSPVCCKHPEGRLVDGGAPAIGSTASQEAAISAVMSNALQLKTLVAGGNGGPDILRIASCEAEGCKDPPRKNSFVCSDHHQVCSTSASVHMHAW